jgi:hypothetical protein
MPRESVMSAAAGVSRENRKIPAAGTAGLRVTALVSA